MSPFVCLAAMLRQQGPRLAAVGDRREQQMRAPLGEQATLVGKQQTARDLRDAAGEASALGFDPAAAQARQLARLQKEQR